MTDGGQNISGTGAAGGAGPDFDFIQLLCHELKAPLSAVRGYLRMIESRGMGDDMSSYDAMIKRCLFRLDGMGGLIVDILCLARARGFPPGMPGAADLVKTALNAVDRIAPEAREKDVTISLDAPESPFPADIPETAAAIIMDNLLSNAVKYNRAGGSARLSLAPAESGAVRIAVSDTGIGIEEKEIPRLFDDFVRIKNDQTRDIPGSGLGLSAVKILAELCGGSVSVESRPGEGSVFTVTTGLRPKERTLK
jgi:signal transduction histidine kinase